MNRKTQVIQSAALGLFGVVFAVGVVLLMLSVFPNLLPDFSQRAEAGTKLEVTFRYSDGDMFALQPGRVHIPEDDAVLGQWILEWDENGFRIPVMQAEEYPIIALGDSFTEGANVAVPWPDLLAANLGQAVRNYGYRGYGPIEISEVARDHLSPEDPPEWVLYAHFSGNDLTNANRTEAIDRSPLARMEWLIRQAQATTELGIIEVAEDAIYPVPVIIGASYYELAFYEELLWWQVAPEEGFLDTATFNVLADALDTVTDRVGADTCKAVIFIPTKEQIYYPYIYPSSRNLFNNAYHKTIVDEHNRVVLQSAVLSPDEIPEFITHLGEQRDAMRILAEENGWLFIDLLEPFVSAAEEEQLLYYRYDGHWNPEGHQLAAQTIADFVENHAVDCHES